MKEEKGDIIIDTTETQRIITNYYKELHANLSLEERDIKFLDSYNIPRLNQEDTDT